MLPDRGMKRAVRPEGVLVLPIPAADGYHNVLTDQCVPLSRDGDRVTIRAADVFEHFPVALLAGR